MGAAGQTGEQKRAAVRLRLASQDGELWRLRAKDCGRIDCQIVNISEGGLLVETTHVLDVNTQVYCRLTLPKGPQVANLAEVVRVEEMRRSGRWSVGLQFIGMPIARCDLLVRWIFAELAARKR